MNGTARDCSCVFHSATLDNSTAQDMAVRITRTTYRQTPGPYRKSSTSHCLILPLLNSFLGRFQFSTKDSDDSVTLSRDIFLNFATRLCVSRWLGFLEDQAVLPTRGVLLMTFWAHVGDLTFFIIGTHTFLWHFGAGLRGRVR